MAPVPDCIPEPNPHDHHIVPIYAAVTMIKTYLQGIVPRMGVLCTSPAPSLRIYPSVSLWQTRHTSAGGFIWTLQPRARCVD